MEVGQRLLNQSAVIEAMLGLFMASTSYGVLARGCPSPTATRCPTNPANARMIEAFLAIRVMTFEFQWVHLKGHRADVQPIALARIDMTDVSVDECIVDRTVTVQPRTAPQNNYGFTATGIVPVAACEPSVVPFIGNWWSVTDGEASVLSNNIAGQSVLFLDTAETIITIVPSRGSQLTDVFGAESAIADAFAFSGFIPENDDSVEIIANVGPVGAPIAD